MLFKHIRGQQLKMHHATHHNISVIETPGPLRVTLCKSAKLTWTLACPCSNDPSVRSRVSEPHTDVRHINAMAASNDRKWLAVAEFMAGGRSPQVRMHASVGWGLMHQERGNGVRIIKRAKNQWVRNFPFWPVCHTDVGWMGGAYL
jgi:hypothetical protein